jgi:hypothetical protein
VARAQLCVVDGASARSVSRLEHLWFIVPDHADRLSDRPAAARRKGLSQDNRIGRKESGDGQERNERIDELA